MSGTPTSRTPDVPPPSFRTQPQKQWWSVPTGTFETHAQVVVVGAGAAGSFVATTLAEAGLDVVLLEEGHSSDKKPRNIPEAATRHYAEGSFRTSMGSNPPMPVVGGRGLGGSTLVNSALCFRTPASTLDEWRDLAPGIVPSNDEWYAVQDAVETVLSVATTPDDLLSGNDRIQKQACGVLGWSEFNARRNAPGCAGCGRCHLVCPARGKASVDLTMLPRAAAAGARIFAGCRVADVATGRVSGELVDAVGNPTGTFSVTADHVVLSAGAISTPRILHDSGVVDPDGEVGRGLCLQPVHSILAMIPETQVYKRGATQGHVVDEFVDDRMIFETNPTLSAMFANLPFHGTALAEVLAQSHRIANTGGLIRDTSRGRVGGSINGVARISYDLNATDMARIQRVFRRGAELWLDGAGAEWVAFTIYGQPPSRTMDEVLAATPDDMNPQRLLSYASHPQGSCSVGRATDHTGTLLERPGISCIDAGSLPNNVGRNPQISVMTMARLLSSRLAGELGGTVQPLVPA